MCEGLTWLPRHEYFPNFRVFAVSVYVQIWIWINWVNVSSPVLRFVNCSLCSLCTHAKCSACRGAIMWLKKSNAIILSIFLLKFFFQLQLISVWLVWPFTLQGSSLAKGINVVTVYVSVWACADVCNHWLYWVIFNMDKFWLLIFLHAFSCAQIYNFC